MEFIRHIDVDTIESILIQLGSGNHEGNMSEVGWHNHRGVYLLDKEEFLNLILLHSPQTAPLHPEGTDFRLKSVAKKCLDIIKSEDLIDFDGRWIPDKIFLTPYVTEFEKFPILIRTSNRFEPSGFYIQDGSHRSLHYAMNLLTGREFKPVHAIVLQEKSC